MASELNVSEYYQPKVTSNSVQKYLSKYFNENISLKNKKLLFK